MRFVLGLIVILSSLAGCGRGGQSVVQASTKEIIRTTESDVVEPSALGEDTLPSLWKRSAGDDWPKFLGPTADSKSSETGLIVPWPQKGPRIVWQREVGTSYGIGCVAAGRYFHFDREDNRRGRGTVRLTCMNAETGQDLWQFTYKHEYEDQLGYNNGPRCSPIVDGNRIYLLGVEGMLFCLRASDGKVVWKVNTNEKFGVVQNFFGVGSTPVISGNLLICIVGGSPPGSGGLYESNGAVDGNGSGIVAFDKMTGEVKYSITDELASYSVPRLATIGDRQWCFALCRGGLVAFEPLSGKVDFQYPWRAKSLESVNASTPVAVGNEVFISETYQIGSSLLAVKPGGFDLVWKDDPRTRDKSFKAHWNTPIFVDGYLYGCSGRNEPDAEMRCIEWKTGKVMWSEQTFNRSSLLYVDGHFISMVENGELQLIKVNPKRLEVVSSVAPQIVASKSEIDESSLATLLRSPCWAAPILSHGLLYVRGDDRVVCLEIIPDRAKAAK